VTMGHSRGSSPELGDEGDTLAALFRPRSVAIVGASEQSGKWGNLIVRHVLKHFRGNVYPVNPRSTTIAGLPAFPSVRDLPEPPSLAVIGVPRDQVATIVEDCGHRGCRVAVIVTSGFADAGAAGRREQERLLHCAQTHGVRIVGPNCMGVYSAAAGLYASVALNPGPTGGVAVLSQSGNVGVAMFEQFRRHGVGMHSFVGLGNQADVTASELIAELARDETCSVVSVYLEDVGDGRQLLEALVFCSRRKPVVVLRGGGEVSGAAAARSHTGSLATPARLSQQLFEEAGAIVVHDLDDLTTTALVLSCTPRRRTRRLAILTDGGGFGVLAADEVDRVGLRLANVGKATRAAIRGALPAYCSVDNPTDVGGDSDSNPSVFGTVGVALLADPGVDALLISGIVGGYGATFDPSFEEVERRVADSIVKASQEQGKAVVVQSVWSVDSAPVLEQFTRHGVPVVESLRCAVRALGHLDRYVEWSSHWRRPPRGGHRPAAKRARDMGLFSGHTFDEAEAYRLLVALGARVPDFSVVATETEAVVAAKRIGYPLVVKALVASAHKSEVGAVALWIVNEQALRRAVRSMRKLSKEILLAAQIPGVAEVLVGGMYDDRFGPIVSLGIGGLLTEALGSAVFARAPLDAEHARALLRRDPVLRRVLESRRRGAPLALDELVKLVVLVGDLSASSTSPFTIELNPVILDEQHAWVVDAKIRRER